MEEHPPTIRGASGATIPWASFRKVFLEIYFPEDVKNKKEIEFLELN